MLRKTKALTLLAGAVFAIGVLATVFLPRWRAGLVVRKVLRYPACSLSDAEVSRLATCIQSRGGLFVPSIPSEQQAKLDQAGIKRTSQLVDPFLIHYMGREWRETGRFATLPSAVGAAVRRGDPNAGLMIVEAGGGIRSGYIDPFLDVQHVMTSSTDQHLIVACLIGLRMKTLQEHRRGCLQMLERQELGDTCKVQLLERIAEQHVAPAWFRGKQELLLQLRNSANPRLVGAANEILQQIGSGAPAPPGTPSTGTRRWTPSGTGRSSKSTTTAAVRTTPAGA